MNISTLSFIHIDDIRLHAHHGVLPVKATEQAPEQTEVADSTTTSHYIHQIAIDAMPGLILHTNEFLRGSNPEVRTMNHDMGFRLKYAFSALRKRYQYL